MSHEFDVVVEEENDLATVFRVTGRLDAKNAQELLRKAKDARERGKKRLIINLAQVSFVASSGIGALLALTEEFQDLGGAVHLVALSEAVSSVVELLNLTQFLRIGENEREVLQALGA